MLLPVVCRAHTGSHLFLKPLRYRLGCAVYFRPSRFFPRVTAYSLGTRNPLRARFFISVCVAVLTTRCRSDINSTSRQHISQPYFPLIHRLSHLRQVVYAVGRRFDSWRGRHQQKARRSGGLLCYLVKCFSLNRTGLPCKTLSWFTSVIARHLLIPAVHLAGNSRLPSIM